MTNNTRFSIILPVYNVEKYLNQCLESIINQTFKDFEIICINDGSTDNSLQILNEYAQKDNRIKVLNQQNQGQGAARNRGIKEATGEYISFIDPDDWVDINMFKELDEFIKKYAPKILQFEITEYYEYPEKIRNYNTVKKFKRKFHYDLTKKNYYTLKDLKNKTLRKKSPLSWNKVYLREFIIDNNIRFANNKYSEDHIFSIMALYLTDKIYYLNKSLYNYRHRIGSQTNKSIDNIMWIFENIRLIKDFLISIDEYKNSKNDFESYALKTIISGYNNAINPFQKQDYKAAAKDFLSKKNYFVFLIKIKDSFRHKIFSIGRYKINGVKKIQIYLFGIKIIL